MALKPAVEQEKGMHVVLYFDNSNFSFICSKKHKGERHTDSRMSEESGDSGDHQQLQQQQQQQSQGSHLLQPDADLREHIEHVKNNFQPLNTVIEQVKETAM